MAKMTEKQLRERDAKRDIGKELLQAAREMKAGKAGRIHLIEVSTPEGASRRVTMVARPKKGTPPPPRIPSTINERLRRRLKKDRPTTTIT
jgi:hypothetical protein